MKSVFRIQFISLIIASIAFLGSLVAFYFFSTTMKAKEARVLEARDHLASFEQNKRIFTEEAKELEVIKNRVEALETNLLTKESIPTLLSSLESMATARNVVFTLTAVNQPETSEGVDPILHIEFSAEGSFADLELLATDMLTQSYQATFTRFSLYFSDTAWQLLAGINVKSF